MYHIAAIYRQAGLSAGTYRAINADAVRHIIEAAARGGARRVVHCSTVGVHGDVEHPPANEAAPLRPVFVPFWAFDTDAHTSGTVWRSSGGVREMIPTLTFAALAAGAQGLFMETHPDPDHAPSDGPNMVPLDKLDALITKAVDIWAAARS